VITDNLNTPRIDLFVAAVQPARYARIARSFQAAEALLGNWNIDYQGWPIHDMQRAFLRSLLLDINPLPLSVNKPSAAGSPRMDTGALTPEPGFTPRPGVFKGDTEVTLRCATPGATMHFTVDGSQPTDSSPVYRAPIMVKGTELTIKAFAGLPDKKDSAVVTGIFRIEQ
jgi:hypothetical protein